jgi:transposase
MPSPAIFIYSASRRRDRLKIMYWDTDGFAVWAKRLEEGVYKIPSSEPGARRIEITTEELAALLSGIDLSAAPRRKRYRRRAPEVLQNQVCGAMIR